MGSQIQSHGFGQMHNQIIGGFGQDNGENQKFKMMEDIND